MTPPPRSDPSPPAVECPQCLSQKRFAGSYASPNEDVLCGFHTSELRWKHEQELAAVTKERDELKAKLEREECWKCGSVRFSSEQVVKALNRRIEIVECERDGLLVWKKLSLGCPGDKCGGNCRCACHDAEARRALSGSNKEGGG